MIGLKKRIVSDDGARVLVCALLAGGVLAQTGHCVTSRISNAVENHSADVATRRQHGLSQRSIERVSVLTDISRGRYVFEVRQLRTRLRISAR